MGQGLPVPGHLPTHCPGSSEAGEQQGAPVPVIALLWWLLSPCSLLLWELYVAQAFRETMHEGSVPCTAFINSNTAVMLCFVQLMQTFILKLQWVTAMSKGGGSEGSPKLGLDLQSCVQVSQWEYSCVPASGLNWRLRYMSAWLRVGPVGQTESLSLRLNFKWKIKCSSPDHAVFGAEISGHIDWEQIFCHAYTSVYHKNIFHTEEAIHFAPGNACSCQCWGLRTSLSPDLELIFVKVVTPRVAVIKVWVCELEKLYSWSVNKLVCVCSRWIPCRFNIYVSMYRAQKEPITHLSVCTHGAQWAQKRK